MLIARTCSHANVIKSASERRTEDCDDIGMIADRRMLYAILLEIVDDPSCGIAQACELTKAFRQSRRRVTRDDE